VALTQASIMVLGVFQLSWEKTKLEDNGWVSPLIIFYHQAM
jgi:hypothetical protein